MDPDPAAPSSGVTRTALLQRVANAPIAAAGALRKVTSRLQPGGQDASAGDSVQTSTSAAPQPPASLACSANGAPGLLRVLLDADRRAAEAEEARCRLEAAAKQVEAAVPALEEARGVLERFRKGDAVRGPPSRNRKICTLHLHTACICSHGKRLRLCRQHTSAPVPHL